MPSTRRSKKTTADRRAACAPFVPGANPQEKFMSARLPCLPDVRSFRRFGLCALSAAAIALAPLPAARAKSTLSDASALSMLPVAVSVAAPVMLLAAGVSLTLVAIEASATGTVWVLERASDGARATLRFSGEVVGGASAALGAAILV